MANPEDCAKALPVGIHTYDLILCDPPWPYRNMYGRTKQVPEMTGLVPAYAQMTLARLKNLPVPSLRNPTGSYMLMWSTGPHLGNAIALMKSWGFEYTTVFLYWRKVKKDGNPRLGLGRYSRSCAEFLLLGRHGDDLHHLRTGCHTLSQEFQAQIRKHSQKPVEVYNIINRFFSPDAKKIELFARVDGDVPAESLAGWHQWGLDIPGYMRQL